MYVSARSDYALRAMLAVADAAHEPAGGGELVKAATLADSQEIPLSFLQGILVDLRRAGLLLSHRGTEGGYALARPAAEISVGDVLRAVGGSLTTVRGLPADRAGYQGVATGLRDVWLAVHGAIALVVDRTTLADLLATGAGAPRPAPTDRVRSADARG
ncbi:Rrf2 family transcriptional regulator [Micromonospora phytophila]|uniref:RrF2 family transcriptional regulator n=1 Tax=Micromonospora phytophila TaxID=709888 RepID=UPI00202FCC7A|nr:Rrf2 family transcriptional regulator [Micromonospora phytophila]MCM0676934.1 Rrf2 family transcriptional regulator [Micromonospora phytophila]